MNERPMHYQARYEAVCRYCGDYFMSKKKNGDVCYEEACQNLKESDRRRAAYERKKKQREWTATTV